MGTRRKKHVILTCEYCKNKFEVIPSLKNKRRCCSKICMGKYNSVHKIGKANPNYSGGTTEQKIGYILINTGPNKREYEHRIVMAKHLGRDLTKAEVIHHIDGNKKNNCVTNLMLFKNQSTHTKYHSDLRLLE